jgi:anti-sigma B factor antagonist
MVTREVSMSKWEKLQVERADHADPAVMVARLRGALMGTSEGYAFLEGIQEEARKGPLRLVINLRDVVHMDSSGVGILAATYTSILKRGGRLCLTGVEGRTAALLKAVHLFDVLERAETEEIAIRKVGG